MTRSPGAATAAPRPGVRIISFGYGHGDAPGAHLTVDLRAHFRDPHIRPEFRDLTADSDEVRLAVLATPGITQVIYAAEQAALGFRAGPSAVETVIAFGCVGGRHRSAVCAQELCFKLQNLGINVEVEHRDIARPVLERSPA